jgi:hypothetical protein
VHRDNGVRVIEEAFGGKRCLLRSHGEVSANWKENMRGLVKLIDELHVAKDTSVTGVVNTEFAELGESNHPTGSGASIENVSIVHAAAGTMVGGHHCVLSEAEVSGATLVH